MKWMLFFVWLVLLSPSVQAQFIFDTNNGAITITAYTGTGGTVIIPNSTNGFPVTSIGTNAFENASITSVIIPNSITNIGSVAFFGCGSMTNLTLPTNILSIQPYTFFGCTNLTSVSIPTAVVNIGLESFYNCSGLTNVVIPTNVTVIDQMAFSGCSGLRQISIPNSVTTLAYGAFSSCSSLTQVIIPPSITSLAGNLFFDCYDLTNVTIPNSVTNIGDYTFESCWSLSSIAIPTNVTGLGQDAFYDCSALTSIAIPDGVTSIGAAAFEDCMSLHTVILPKYLNDIEEGAFDQCVDLTDLNIPNTVTNIGDSAFLFCVGLAHITLSTNLTSIGSAGFFGCSSLTSIIIPASVTNIGSEAFSECNGLTSLTIPSGVLSLGSQALAYCPQLSSVYFLGNAPASDSSVLVNDDNPTVYYLAGTSGWTSTFADCPTVMLNAPNPSGSLQVTINPSAVSIAGASWQVDQGIPQPSGATVVGLAVGLHTVSFKNVAHWTAPGDLTVAVLANQTVATNATYAVSAQIGPYATAILSLQPVAYWQLDETDQVPAADVITNGGSLGLFGDGFPFNGVGQGLPGVVGLCASFSNPSLDVTYFGSYVAVPYNATLNPPGPFTVEFWANPIQSVSDYFCPVSSVDISENSGNSRCGYLFYQGPGSQWVFRVGNINGYVANIAGGMVQTNAWQHIAGVYDGTNVMLYVNGALVAGPAPATGYSPNTNSLTQFRIGATSFGNRTFDGSVDELAVYTNALGASTIAAHYQAASTNNGNYDAQVLEAQPVGYWNLDEPAYIVPSALPTAFNLGTLSVLANGVFEPGSVTGAAGVPGDGFQASNKACAFQANSDIDVPGASLQFSGPITLVAWIKAPSSPGHFQSIASLGTNAYCLTLDGLGYPHFSDGLQPFGDLIGPKSLTDGQWHQLVGTYDGINTECLYADGLLAVSSTNATAIPLMTGEDFWIGGNPDLGSFEFFNGEIDEVAIFTNALTANQVLWLFSAASDLPVLRAPNVSSSSGSAVLTWSSVAGLTYQIQSKTNLAQPVWTSLSGTLTATNSTVTIPVPTGAGHQAYYRISVSP